MAYPIDQKLVIAVSSTALFDFTFEHQIFRSEGLEAFRKYQVEHRSKPPEPGAAYPFIKRLLHLNKIYADVRPIEVVILSRNHPDAGQRVMDSMAAHDLDISRGSFLSGKLPYPYMQSYNSVLYLSTNEHEVREAVENGFPAGHVLPCRAVEDELDTQLRIAFDFDGVIVDDEAETVYQAQGLPLFHHVEKQLQNEPMNAGPLMPLLKGISKLQQLEKDSIIKSNDNQKKISVAIVTARNAPAHGRLITTLTAFGVETDELHLSGGIEKNKFIEILKPQIFFDDQLGHFKFAAENTPCVHIPFGIQNKRDKSEIIKSIIGSPGEKGARPAKKMRARKSP
jgi:5'-nucleotidase